MIAEEADHQSETLALYVDGKKDATGPGVGAGVSLANSGNLYVVANRNASYWGCTGQATCPEPSRRQMRIPGIADGS